MLQARLQALPPIYVPPKLGSSLSSIYNNPKRVETMSKIGSFTKDIQSLLEVKCFELLDFFSKVFRRNELLQKKRSSGNCPHLVQGCWLFVESQICLVDHLLTSSIFYI